jgi:salicylate hydroxylase
LQAALEAGVHLHTNTQVVTIDPSFEAKVTLSNGDHVEGDILVGADGIKSCTRANIASYFGLPDKCTSTGDSAYRIVIPRSKILERCPQILKTLGIDQGISTRWIGPYGHIMAYPIRGNAFYNVVMVHSHKSGAINDDETNLWARKGELSELLTFYGGWSNTVQGLAACIDPEDLTQWPLNARPSLPAWKVNRICLLGDACHPMLPYVAQGAAQAIEDAAALAVCLSRTSDVSQALATYESVRKDRAEFIQGCADAMRQVLHLVDGPEQEQRDATMRAPRTPGWKHPDLWADLDFQQLIWGHDIVVETEKRYYGWPRYGIAI